MFEIVSAKLSAAFGDVSNELKEIYPQLHAAVKEMVESSEKQL